ncbi:class IV adenylate cyclase [Comamonas sp. NoAH]|uniref:class IV adenylate cyclase n=1 Tax=Comamonas halotolerans TaxID=3041496 RepID=UPI0024E04849|nr:class IV adenylate cyclase [Comamonas sp. NoAH]
MARSIEIKARIDDLDMLRGRISQLATAGPALISQDDTYFQCNNGRLTLRQFSDGNGELIFYQRSAKSGPDESIFSKSPTTQPDSLRALLSHAYGQIGRVKKMRTLFFVDRTRVHVDWIQDLGHFIEIQTELADNEPSSNGAMITEMLMEKLGVPLDSLLHESYLDLITKKR